jgi:hypothetical protein
MNLKSFLTITFLAVAASVNAQSYFSMGPSVGFQHSWISFDHPESTSNVFHPGFNAGVSMVYSTESHFGLGADLKYSQEGVTVQTDVLNVKTETDLNTSYIRAPFRLIYFFGDYGNAIRPKLFAGPTVAFLVSAKSEAVDVKESTNSFDAGVHGGVGLNVRLMPNIWLNTDITYTQGLSDVTENDVDDKNHNGNIGINAGVLFGF